MSKKPLSKSLAVVLAALAVAGVAEQREAEASEPERAAARGEAEAYAAYAAFAERHGMKPREGRALVIGIRGRDLARQLHPTRVVRAFDDTLVVLTPDGRVVELAASTHPWETEGRGAPDVDGDGRPDIGMIRPGKYLAVRRGARRNIGGGPTYHVLTRAGGGSLPGWRNTNQDEVYSPAERAASEARGDALTAVLFHQAAEGGPKAIGCQVLDASGMRRLAEEVGARFDYLLVDANAGAVP